MLGTANWGRTKYGGGKSEVLSKNNTEAAYLSIIVFLFCTFFYIHFPFFEQLQNLQGYANILYTQSVHFLQAINTLLYNCSNCNYANRQTFKYTLMPVTCLNLLC